MTRQDNVSIVGLVDRVATLEAQVEHLSKTNDEILKHTKELIGLRDKGIGAFWLASSLVGAGIVGFVSLVAGWFK